MLYSLFVMIGDGKRSFWCGTEGEYIKKNVGLASPLGDTCPAFSSLCRRKFYGGPRVKAAEPVR